MLSNKPANLSIKTVNIETIEFINQLIYKNTHSKTKKVMNFIYSIMFGLIASKYLPSKHPKTVMGIIAFGMYLIGEKIGNKNQTVDH